MSYEIKVLEDNGSVQNFKDLNKCDYLPLPQKTSVEISALTGMKDGSLVYDTDLNQRFVYNGSVWEVLPSTITVDNINERTVSNGVDIEEINITDTSITSTSGSGPDFGSSGLRISNNNPVITNLNSTFGFNFNNTSATTGQFLFQNASGADYLFSGGTDMTVSITGDMRIDSISDNAGTGAVNFPNGLTSGGSDIVLTGSDLGGTAGTFKQKTGTDLEFRGITAGSGISVVENATDITISATGGSGGEVFRSSEYFEAFLGSPSRGVSSSYLTTLSFFDSSTGGVVWNEYLGNGYTSGDDVTLYIYWYSGSSGGGNDVYWNLEAGVQDFTGAVSFSGATQNLVANAPASAFDFAVDSFVIDGSTFVTGNGLTIALSRLGADGNDTFTGTVSFLGIRVVY